MEAGGVHGQLDTLILAVLRDGETHGYAIITALRDRTDDALDLPTGTVYPALRRLERQGYARGEWRVVNGRRRRTYALTQDGLTALSKGERQWRALSGIMTAILGR